MNNLNYEDCIKNIVDTAIALQKWMREEQRIRIMLHRSGINSTETNWTSDKALGNAIDAFANQLPEQECSLD
jgi:hypothetical protein